MQKIKYLLYRAIRSNRNAFGLVLDLFSHCQIFVTIEALTSKSKKSKEISMVN